LSSATKNPSRNNLITLAKGLGGGFPLSAVTGRAAIDKVADIRAAHAAGKIAFNLHFQGSNPIAGDLSLVEVYRRLGVGHMLLAYNGRNLAGDGCHEPGDAGLSVFGKELIAEMNRVKMIVDLAHTGTRTARAGRRSTPRSCGFWRKTFSHASRPAN
jgi:hypothetical protein